MGEEENWMQMEMALDSMADSDVGTSGAVDWFTLLRWDYSSMSTLRRVLRAIRWYFTSENVQTLVPTTCTYGI